MSWSKCQPLAKEHLNRRRFGAMLAQIAQVSLRAQWQAGGKSAGESRSGVVGRAVVKAGWDPRGNLRFESGLSTGAGGRIQRSIRRKRFGCSGIELHRRANQSRSHPRASGDHFIKVSRVISDLQVDNDSLYWMRRFTKSISHQVQRCFVAIILTGQGSVQAIPKDRNHRSAKPPVKSVCSP